MHAVKVRISIKFLYITRRIVTCQSQKYPKISASTSQMFYFQRRRLARDLKAIPHAVSRLGFGPAPSALSIPIPDWVVSCPLKLLHESCHRSSLMNHKASWIDLLILYLILAMEICKWQMFYCVPSWSVIQTWVPFIDQNHCTRIARNIDKFDLTN